MEKVGNKPTAPINLAKSSNEQNSPSSSPKTSTEQNSSYSSQKSTPSPNTSTSSSLMKQKSLSKQVSKESIIVEKQLPADPNPRNTDTRPRTYENFRIYFGELFSKLIPLEFLNSSIPAIKSNSLSSQAYERLHSKSMCVNNNIIYSFINLFILIIRAFASLAN